MKHTRALVFLFSAHIISNFASGITMLAIPWYMVSKLDAADTNALIMAGITFLTLFWSTYAGTLIDRYNRKRIFQAQQVGAGSILIGAAVYGMSTGDMPIPLIGVCAGATIFSWSIYYPNLYAFVQELFEPKYYKQINSGIELVGQFTNFLGMLVGSVMLAGTDAFTWWPEALTFQGWELSEIILMDGVTYLCAAVIISPIRYTPGKYAAESSGGLFDRVREGYRFLRARPELMVFGICSHIVFACLLVFVHAGLSMYVQYHLGMGYEEGAVASAEFEAVYSIGAVLAGLSGIFLAKWMQKTNLIRQITFLLFLMAGIYFAFSVWRAEWIIVIGSLLTGICNAGCRILRITYIVRIVPNEVIGRTNSFFSVVNVAMRLAFLLMLTIPFFNSSNIVYGLVIMGVACAFCGVLLLIYFPKFDQKAAYG
ncbi:MAG: MFS transporter [Bacteroidota bacterium]